MKILALTHAHLHADGLSPVSCERVDSFAFAVVDRLKWTVDIVYTSGTKWAGIWPMGKGLNAEIIEVTANESRMMGAKGLFASEIRRLAREKKFSALFPLFARRMSARLRHILSEKGLADPEWMVKAKKWGRDLLHEKAIRNKQYDYIFVSVGYGDEYLLQTALVLSKAFRIPMIVDFRDLWSEHHDPNRFTARQKQRIRRYEQKLLATTAMISVPQKFHIQLLQKWTTQALFHYQHSAYVAPEWEDGVVVSDEFRMVYAGKLYSNGPGAAMLMGFIKKLITHSLRKPLRFNFFVDETEVLRQLVAHNEVEAFVSIHPWVSPSKLWKEIRSAHMLVIIDSSTYENYPLLLTKTFQYAYTGRPLLVLQKYRNIEMEEFLDQHNAGAVFTDTDEAVDWTTKMADGAAQYQTLPELRKMPLRIEEAARYGRWVEEQHRKMRQ